MIGVTDWTGRQLHPAKRGAIPKDVPPVIERLGSSADIWMHFVRKFGSHRHVQSVTPINQQAVTNGLKMALGLLS
ncbi:MAG: hypothetical protein R3C49_00590 [Planctomycetaceae bacterium]